MACLVGLLVVSGGGLPTSGVDTADIPRDAGVNVTTDDSAAHTLVLADNVSVNSTEQLVTITNRVTRDVTVSVTLRSDSTHIGDLVVDGTASGDAVSLTLLAGAQESVDLAVADDSTLAGETVHLHVTADASAIAVNASNRAVPVVS